MTEALDRTFAALADPTRRSIIAVLADGERTVNDLVAMHELSQPAITKHLKVLEGAGLVRRARVGQTRPCHLEPEGLKRVAGWVERYRAQWDGAFDRMDEYLKSLRFPEKPND